MKKIFFTLASLVFLLTAMAQNSTYNLEATLTTDKFDGKTVYIQYLNMDSLRFEKLDSATIENKSFSFLGKELSKPVYAYVVVADERRPLGSVVLESGNIKLEIDSVAPSKISGTKYNEVLQASFDAQSKYKTVLDSLSKVYREEAQKGEVSPEFEKQISEQYDTLSDSLMLELFKLTKENITNPIGEFYLVTSSSYFKPAQIDELIALVTPEFNNTKAAKEIQETLRIAKATEIGQPYIDIKFPSLDDKEIALSDYVGKNKVILVDFWASWCGPCIKEMPNVKEAYAKFKDKGFEIVGVSLDNDKSAWEAATKRLEISWPQMSDLGGWKSEAAAAYGVKSIPMTLLLDIEGKIIAKNLRGKELEDKLAELLDGTVASE